jgi:hypothetical protein
MKAVRLARNAWERVWFAPESPLNLASARLVLAFQAFWILLSRDIPALSGLPAELWVDVEPAARFRYLLWEGRPGLEAWLQALALLALAGVVLGVATRACCLISGLLLYHLAPLETLFFTPSPWAKGLTLPVLGLLTLSVTRCGERLALLPSVGAVAGNEDGWALRLVRLFVCQQYFFSGWAKLAAAGLGWASAENIRAWLLLANLDDQLVAFGTPGLWLADRPALCLLMGVTGLTLDLGFVAAPFSSRARRLLAPAGLLFHLAILLTLNYAFLGAPLLLLLVDWQRPDGRRLYVQEPASGSGGKSASSGPAIGVTASPS